MQDLISTLNKKLRQNGDNIEDKVFGRFYEQEGYEIYIIVLKIEGKYKIYEAKQSYNTDIIINTVTMSKDILNHLNRAAT